jgi:hypothetical protein
MQTVTALFETRADAERARDELSAAQVSDQIEIHDQASAEIHGTQDHFDIVDWLGSLFSGHRDKHLYGEGIRRGHYLVTARIADVGEPRAIQILESAGALNLHDAHQDWRSDGWSGAPESGGVFGAETESDAEPAAPVYQLMGVRVRVYPVDG